jgi:outer membrane protein
MSKPEPSAWLRLAPLGLGACLASCSSSAPAPATVVVPPAHPEAPLLQAVPSSSEVWWRAFAVVDLQRAALETEDGLRAQARLKAIFTERQKKVDEESAKVRAEQEALARASPRLSPAERDRRQAVLDRRLAELHSTYVQFQTELQQKQTELTQPIMAKLLRVLRRLAAARNLRFVADKQSLYVSPGDNDLTGELIQAYEADPEPATPPQP